MEKTFLALFSSFKADTPRVTEIQEKRRKHKPEVEGRENFIHECIKYMKYIYNRAKCFLLFSFCVKNPYAPRLEAGENTFSCFLSIYCKKWLEAIRGKGYSEEKTRFHVFSFDAQHKGAKKCVRDLIRTSKLERG